MAKIRNGKLNRSSFGNSIILFFLFIFALLMSLPLVYSVSTSLKPFDELWVFPPRFIVQNPTLKNFTGLFSLVGDTWVPFSRYIFNTVIIAVVGTTGHVLLASMCAYAIAKLPFVGKKLCFNMVVLSLMFSGAVTGIPSYFVMHTLGWVNSYLIYIVPAFASSLGLYLMKQFMEQMVPDTTLEAARIDGASEFRIFFRIVMPMVKPGWLTLIVFSFQGLWNVGASPYVYNEELKSLNYALAQLLSSGIARTGASMAASVLMMITPIAVFLFTQSNVVETMSTSGMKE